MATAKLISENEITKHEKMIESESVTLPMEERQKGGIYECVSKYPTNIDYLKMILGSGTEDVNFRGENGRTALHEAVRKDEVETVKLLMSAGASLEFRDIVGNTALHYVDLDADPENENAGEVFKILFPLGKNAESIRISKTRKLSEIQKCSCHMRTFEQTWFDAATSTNNNGDNILNLILQGNNLNETQREIVQYLIKETEIFYLLKLLRNTQRALQNSTFEVERPIESNDNFSINSPFRRLLELYPEIISDLMDRCIVKSQGKVHYHFELLDDTYLLHTWPPQQEYYCKWLYESKWEHIHAKEKQSRDVYTKDLSKISNNHPLMLMLKHNTSKDPGKRDVYRQLVDHPLVKALIEHKWLHIGRKFHILSLIIYLIFLCSLTAFLIVIDTLYVRFQDSDNISTTSNKTGCINSTVCTSTYICNYSKDCNSTTPCYSTSSYNVTTTPTTQDLVTCETYGNDPMIIVLQILIIFLGIILAIKESRYDYNKDYIYAFGDHVCADKHDHDYDYSPNFDYNINNKLSDLNDHDF